MADVKTEQEPSIEEILESIRQIISEDAPAADKAGTLTLQPEPAPPKSAYVPPPPPPQPDKSVLDLTQKVEAPDKSNWAYEEAEVQVDDSDLVLKDVPVSGGGGLMESTTETAAAGELARLLQGNAYVDRDEPTRVGKVTLEDIARDLMRPVIKSWLDQNLPRMVEKMVAKEIDRLSKRVS